MRQTKIKRIVKRIDGHQLILGVPVFSGKVDEVLIQAEKTLEEMGNKLLMVLFTPTTEQVVMAQHDKQYCTILMQSTINVPDTAGIQWALRRTQGKRSERMPGVDLAEDLVLKTLQRGKKVFLVGGKAGVARIASEKLLSKLKTQNFPLRQGFKGQAKLKSITENLKLNTLIAAESGAVNIAKETEAERQRVLKCIRDFKPALVLVAYGAPWQERWVINHAAALSKAGVKIAMVVGGAFDMWAGKVPRAPLQWRNLGLEWLWRLIHEPWRWRRQLRLVEFVGRVGWERIFSFLG